MTEPLVSKPTSPVILRPNGLFASDRCSGAIGIDPISYIFDSFVKLQV